MKKNVDKDAENQCNALLLEAVTEESGTVAGNVTAIFENESYVVINDLPRALIPFGYQLDLQPSLEDGNFKGLVQVTILCLDNTSTVVLHAHASLQIPVDDIEMKQLQDDDNSSLLLHVSSVHRESRNQHLTIELVEELQERHTYILKIPFSGLLASPQEAGLYRSSFVNQATGEKSWYIATNLKTGTARRMFPCFDTYDYKTNITISVAQPENSNHTIVSSGSLRSVDQKTGDPLIWTHFSPAGLILASSVGIAQFKFQLQASRFNPFYMDSVKNTFGRIDAYGRQTLEKPLQALLDELLRQLQVQQEYFDMELPMEIINVVAVPELSAKIKTSWGIIQLLEKEVENKLTLTNALLDLWFDHVISPLPSMTSIRKSLNKFMLCQTGLLSWVPHYALYYSFAKPVISKLAESEAFEPLKNEWTLRLLNYSLSQDVFRSGFRRFMLNRMYSVYRDIDLWEFVHREADVSVVLLGRFTVEQLVDSWNSTKRYPIVTVTRNYENNTAVVEQHTFIRERPHNPDDSDNRWVIPIMYLTPNNVNPSSVRTTAWMEREKQISVDGLPGADDFIIVNPEEIGMFVVNYDERNWFLLSQCLQSSSSSVPALTRAKLLHDAWNIGYSGEVSMVVALNISLFLSRETQYEVWLPFLNVFDHIHRYVSGTTVETKLEKYVVKTMMSAKSRGAAWVENNPDLLTYGYEPHVTRARQAYNKWMNSVGKPLQSMVAHGELCAVLRWGSMEEYEFSLDHLLQCPHTSSEEKKERSSLHRALAGCPRHYDKVDKLLQVMFVDKTSKFSRDDVYAVLVHLSNHETGWTAWFNFLSSNWDILKDRYGNDTHVWNVMVHLATHHVITQEGFDKIKAFHSTHEGEFGSAEPVVQEALVKAAQEVGWTNRNLAVMDQWLDHKLAGTD